MNLATFSVVLSLALPAASGFANNGAAIRPRSARQSSKGPQSRLLVEREGGFEFNSLDIENPPSPSRRHSRRGAIARAAGQLAAGIAAASAAFSNPTVSCADIEGVVTIPQSTAPPTSTASNVDGKSVTVFKTKSGLQYIDIAEGAGATPKYGNFVSIAYKAYVKLPDAKGRSFKLDEFDHDEGYLVKHGNGRTVPGLDEGLHTMRVGGKRRIIVPPKLGYVTSGLGPIPVGPYGRWKLNRLIDRMVELRGGNVIFDVVMNSVMEDEADQGYYTDESLSPEDFGTLRQNIEASQQAARGK
ncbi:hypothetical protein ACHAW5_004937 [Stephanodiscus triporus]|uniref:peptidylprolyl isomerase n=1 Tax=Stephanodiscus triporus TaxID=2934178 RepID=A0ABD3N7L8_9STRA